MKTQDHINFERIAEAIGFINTNFKHQPNLDEIAEKVHLSPFHFQRLFTEWAGVSPKKFIQYLSVEYAKQLLKDKQTTLFDTAHETGLSGTGRLHWPPAGGHVARPVGPAGPFGRRLIPMRLEVRQRSESR